VLVGVAVAVNVGGMMMVLAVSAPGADSEPQAMANVAIKAIAISRI
jgi:hypothetical protein